ncbi:MAG: CIA30 family protein [Planctomycetota bacterium]
MKSNLFWFTWFFFFIGVQSFHAEVLFLKGVHLLGQENSLFDLTLQDGRITQIAPHPSKIPSEAEVFDFTGKWLIPGLIDLNCSLFSSPGGGFSGEEFSEEQLSRNQWSLLKAGITSIRILNGPASRSQKLKELSEKRVGPRLFCASPTLIAPKGYPSPLYQDMEDFESDLFLPITEEKQLESLWNPEMNCLYVIVSSGRSISESPLPTLSEELLSQICTEAKKHHVRVVAYVETWQELQQAVQAGVQEVQGGAFFSSELSLLESPEWQEIFQKMREQRIDYCPKIYNFQVLSQYPEFLQKLGSWEKQILSQEILKSVSLPYSVPSELLPQKQVAGQWRDFAVQSALFLKNKQISILVGSGSGEPLTFFGVGLYEQLQLLNQSGWTPEECLELVTLRASQALGVSNDLGKIQEGFLADLFVLEENPLEDLSALKKGIWVHSRNQGYWIKQIDPQLKVGLKSSPITSRFIDDFEDRNLLSSQQKNWDCFSDQVLGGKSQIILQLKEGGAEKSLCSAGISGELSVAFAKRPAFAGIEINLVPEKENAIDISAFLGLEFAVRGKGSFYLKLGTRNIYDFDYYAKEFRLTDEWTTYKISFSEFQQQGFGTPVSWSPDEFTGLTLIFYNQEDHPLPILAQVDEFRFYQK